jgi:hypothetical protein
MYYSVRLIITREMPCIVLYNIHDKDATNIVSLQMNVGFNTYYSGHGIWATTDV